MRCVGRWKGDKWWWNEENMALARMKDVPKMMCGKSSDESKNGCLGKMKVIVSGDETRVGKNISNVFPFGFMVCG